MSVAAVPPTSARAPAMIQDKGASITVTATSAANDGAPPGFKLVKVRKNGVIITVKRPIAPAVQAASTGPATAAIAATPALAATASGVKPTSLPGSGSTALPTSTKIDTLGKAVEPVLGATTQSPALVRAVTSGASATAAPITATATPSAIKNTSPPKVANASIAEPVKPAAEVAKVAAEQTKPTAAGTSTTPGASAKPPATAATNAETKSSASTPAQGPPVTADAATKLKWYENLAKVDMAKVATGVESTAASIEVIGNAVTRIGAVLTGDTAALEAAKAAAAKPASKTTAPSSKAGAAAPQKMVMATTTPATAKAPQQHIVASSAVVPAGGASQAGPTTILLTTPVQTGVMQSYPTTVIVQTAAIDTPRSMSKFEASAPATTQRTLTRSPGTGTTRQALAPAGHGVVPQDTATAIVLAATPGMVQATTGPAAHNSAYAAVGGPPGQHQSRDVSDNYNDYNEYGSNSYPDHNLNTRDSYGKDNGNGGFWTEAAMAGGGVALGVGGTEFYEDYVEGDDIVDDDDVAFNHYAANDQTVDADHADAQNSGGAAHRNFDPSHDIKAEDDDDDVLDYNSETDELYHEGNDTTANDIIASKEDEDDDEIEEYNPETDEFLETEGEHEDKEGTQHEGNVENGGSENSEVVREEGHDPTENEDESEAMNPPDEDDDDDDVNGHDYPDNEDDNY